MKRRWLVASLLFSAWASAQEAVPVVRFDSIPDPLKLPKDLYLGEIEDIEDACLDGAAPLITLEETRDHIRTVLALLESARSGEPAALPA